MKAIRLKTIITGIRSKVDHSLGLTLSTPELTSEERAEFMNLQSVECDTLFNPLNNSEVPREIKSEVSQKTQGQRIRSILFVLYSDLGKPGEFEDFYRMETEKYINSIKDKLDK